jgi:EAL domain-containing protein (putative c-di-GMP-specific phosphodiesterase class I)
VVAALPGDGISVAVSLPAGFVTAEGLSTQVARALATSGLPAERLMLSFTEETLLTASAVLMPELKAVQAGGVKLCLDNYGMGHTLFTLLARVPLDGIRVDVAALASRDDTARALQVFTAILRTAQEFGLFVIAGGLSTPGGRDAVAATGVQLLEGRSEPRDLSPEQLAAMLVVPTVPVPADPVPAVAPVPAG